MTGGSGAAMMNPETVAGAGERMTCGFPVDDAERGREAEGRASPAGSGPVGGGGVALLLRLVQVCKSCVACGEI